MFMTPEPKATVTSKVYFKKVGLGHNYLNPLKLVVPIIIKMYGPRSGLNPVVYPKTNSCFRKTVSTLLPERGVAPDVVSVISGHTAMAQQARARRALRAHTWHALRPLPALPLARV